MVTSVVRLRNVVKSYHLGHTEAFALRGVDLDIEPQELSALLGPSGSGRTTLLNIIGCIDVATSGTYELRGKLIAATDSDALAPMRIREIGFVFQTLNLIPVLSVFENVDLSLTASIETGQAQLRRAPRPTP